MSEASIQRPRASAAILRGFASERASALFVALCFVGISTPQVLNFLRIVPVAGVLALLALHLTAAGGRALGRIRLLLAPAALLLWLALTTVWSDAPGMSMVQSVSTALVVLLAVTVGSACGVRPFVRGVALGGLLVLGLSLAVAAISPATGLMPDGYQGGTLRGLYVHRNLLAEVLTPAYLAALVVAFRAPRRLLKRLVLAGALLGGILLTRSSTALAAVLAATAVAMLVAAVQRVPRRHRHIPLLGAGAVVAAGVTLVAANPGDVLALLGRDSTLTGRALIWQIVQRLIADRPLLGYGWGATWDPTDRIRTTVSTLAKFDVPSAHNGYLDAWLQVGAVGLAAFLLLVLVVLGRGIGLLLRTESPLARWAPVYVSAVLVYNIGEANLDSSLVIFLLTATLTKLYVVRRDGDPTLEAPAESGRPEEPGSKATSPALSRRRRATARRGAGVAALHTRRANPSRQPAAPRGRKPGPACRRS